MFSLLFKTIWRRRLLNILMLCAVCVGIAAVSLLSTVKQTQEVALSSLIDSAEIRCYITSLSGTKSDDLGIGFSFIKACTTRERYDFCDYIERVALKRTMPCLGTISQQTLNLVGINCLEAAGDALSRENGVSVLLYEGYTEELFSSNDLVVLLPYQMASQITPDDTDGIKRISLRIGDGTHTFTVIGEFIGEYISENTLYCPWDVVNEFMASIVDYDIIYTESMSFYLKDNNLLDEFKTEMLNYFHLPDRGAEDDPMKYAIIVQDSVFQESRDELQRNVALVSLLLPLLFALSIGIGFLCSFLSTKNRRQEFAIMRSLGMNKLRLFAYVMSEQVLLIIVGLCLTIAVYAVVWHVAEIQWTSLLIYLLCYMVGSIVCLVRSLSTVNVMSLLSVKE